MSSGTFHIALVVLKVYNHDRAVTISVLSVEWMKSMAAGNVTERYRRVTLVGLFTILGEQRRGAAMIAVTTAGKDPPDGVQGAPVFLGGQLLGFAVQVSRILMSFFHNHDPHQTRRVTCSIRSMVMCTL